MAAYGAQSKPAPLRRRKSASSPEQSNLHSSFSFRTMSIRATIGWQGIAGVVGKWGHLYINTEIGKRQKSTRERASEFTYAPAKNLILPLVLVFRV